ncbi:MAG TPA: PAS domain S-box protein [Bacteroidales bacterium]|nr:PAS domain S-box protein [Bacteroidales bacterium]
MELNKQTKQQLAEELKKMEAELRHWEDNFRLLYENAPEMFFTISAQGNIISVNKNVIELLGYKLKELIGKPIWKIIHPDDLKLVKSKIKYLIENKIISAELKFRKIRNDKSTMFVHERTHLLLDEDGEVKEVHLSCSDLTQSIDPVDESPLYQSRFTDLTDHLNVGLYRSTVDADGTFIEVNAAFVRMLGYESKDELLKLNVSEIYKHTTDRSELQRKIHAKGFIKNQEVILRKKNGETINGSLSAILTRDEHGNPAFYDGIIDDISETKLILNTIRESEYKYRSLVESFYDIIFITDYESKMLFANHALFKHTGFTLRDFQMPQNDNQFIHRDDREKVAKFITSFINNIPRNSGVIENRFIDKYDNVHWFSSVITKIDYDNKPALQFIVRDITKQKEADEELKKRERQYGTLFNLSPNGIIIEDSEGLILDVNPAFCELLGYDKNELLGFNVKSLAHPDARYQVEDNIRKILKGEQLSHTEKSIKKDGTIAYVHLNERKFDLPGGKTGIICIAEDITEQIKAEEALKQSEQKYRLLIENQSDLVVKVDADGRFTFISPSYCRLFGKSEADLLNKKFMPLVHHDDRERTAEEMKKLYKPPFTCYVEQRAKTIEGWRWIAWIDTAILDENNRVKEIIGVGRDITKRKNAEDALLKSEESYKGLFNSAADAIYIVDEKGSLLDANEEAVRIYGFSRDQLIGKQISLFAASVKNNLKEIKRLLKSAFSGNPQKFEFWSKDKKGRVFPQEVRLHKSTYFGKDVLVVFAEDITERKAWQQNLEEKEKRFRRIFNAFPDVYFKSNTEGVLKEVSPSILKITGYTPTEVIGVKSSNFYYSQDEWKAIGNELNTKGEVNDFNIQIVTKDNSRIYCSLTARLINDDNNKPYEIEGVLRDINDRINAELEIKENQRRISTLMANLPGMAYRCKNDRDWTMQFISQGCQDLTGYKPESLINNRDLSYNDLILSEDQDMVWKTIQTALKKKNVFQMAYRITHASGEIRWVWEQGMGIFDDDNNLLGLEGFISNITEQRVAEEEIRKLSRSVEQSPTIIVITDLEGRVEYINPRFVEVTGYSYEEIIGKNPRILKSGNTPNAIYKDLWKTVIAGKKWSGEFQNRKKDGELYWESANIFPLKDENDKITHYIGMKEDITERKKMERELIIAKEKAEESDKLKSAFLANMSHEIRTPMNSIIGFSQLLDDPDLSIDERNHFINLIQNSGNDLMSLIDDIIDISKIEAGQMKIFKSQYMVDQLMRELYHGFHEHVKTNPKTNKLKVIYKAPDHAENIVANTDIDRFKQVIRNLFYNSIKFTDKGYIEFGFEYENPKFKNELLFYVKDTGIGIDPEKKELIFNSFTQANESDTRLYGGTGLGLAISKNIVELLGGRIWVESKPGKGATFYFTLPRITEHGTAINTKPAGKEHQFHEYNLTGKSILVVEDDDSSYDFFERILRRTGANLMRAEDGMQAVKKFRQNKFDVVLMDIRLPRMDGYKTMKKIKSMNPEIPVVAQTAYAMQGEKDKCLKAGFDNYLSKPIKINELLKMVSRYINS